MNDLIGTKGVDGTEWLRRVLIDLSASNDLVAARPDGAVLTRYVHDGLRGPLRLEYETLIVTLVRETAIWWSPDAYTALPVLTPWCVRDRSCRYDHGPEAWSAPRADGYLRDDNSVIKQLPRPCKIVGPTDHPYAGQKPWRGFTACHIWRDLPGGEIAGEDPWLYSFLPNLVWLPTGVAPLTDRRDAFAQRLLQQISRSLFAGVKVAPSFEGLVSDLWSRLPPSEPAVDDVMDFASCFFTTNDAFVRRRLRYLDRFVAGADQVIAGEPLTKRLFSTRYSEGVQSLAPHALLGFRNALAAYAADVRKASTAG